MIAAVALSVLAGAASMLGGFLAGRRETAPPVLPESPPAPRTALPAADLAPVRPALGEVEREQIRDLDDLMQWAGPGAHAWALELADRLRTGLGGDVSGADLARVLLVLRPFAEVVLHEEDDEHAAWRTLMDALALAPGVLAELELELLPDEGR